MDEKEIYQDALDAIRMSDGFISFDEWAPGWMVNENGEYVNNDNRLNALKVIWDKAIAKINK